MEPSPEERLTTVERPAAARSWRVNSSPRPRLAPVTTTRRMTPFYLACDCRETAGEAVHRGGMSETTLNTPLGTTPFGLTAIDRFLRCVEQGTGFAAGVFA